MNELPSLKSSVSDHRAGEETVALDTEVITGPSGQKEVIEIGIVGNDGLVYWELFQPSFPPQSETCRPGLQSRQLRVARSFETAIPAIQEAVRGKRVVMYNSEGEDLFLRESLDTAADKQCAMTRFSGRGGRYSKHHQSYQWVRLNEALQIAGIPKPRGPYHRALVDAEATLLLWQWMEAQDRAICELHHPTFLSRLL